MNKIGNEIADYVEARLARTFAVLGTRVGNGDFCEACHVFTSEPLPSECTRCVKCNVLLVCNNPRYCMPEKYKLDKCSTCVNDKGFEDV
jgi:hypothetical protein